MFDESAKSQIIRLNLHYRMHEILVAAIFKCLSYVKGEVFSPGAQMQHEFNMLIPYPIMLCRRLHFTALLCSR